VKFQNDTGAIQTLTATATFEIQACIVDNNSCNHCFQVGTNQLGPYSYMSVTIAHNDQWFPNNANVPFTNVPSTAIFLFTAIWMDCIL
jgi:hypothetical protein